MARPSLNGETAETAQSLWLLAAGPLCWAGHFLLSYATAAVWCARVAGPGGSLGAARVVIGVYTLVALAGIGATALRAWRKKAYGGETEPFDADSPAGRHRFLGFAAFLLAAMSAVATGYTALAAFLIRSCY